MTREGRHIAAVALAAALALGMGLARAELSVAYLWGNTYRSRGDILSAILQWGF